MPVLFLWFPFARVFLGSIPGLGQSPGEGKGYWLQYSDLENSMDYVVYGVKKSWTQLSDWHFTLTFVFIFSPNLYVEIPRPVWCFQEVGPWEVIKFRLGHEDAALIMALVALKGKRSSLFLPLFPWECTARGPCDNTERSWPFAT